MDISVYSGVLVKKPLVNNSSNVDNNNVNDNIAILESGEKPLSRACSGEVISLGTSPSLSAMTKFSIRGLDIIASTIVLLLALPVLLVLAIMIRYDSPGPILFIHRRVGKDGIEFPFYKFRSMVTNAEAVRATLELQNERNGPVFKMRNDPRITRIGRFMRKYSLDELPQLINVLKGEMSLVGPRPALPREVAQYTPRQSQRLIVTPGVTGLWQVSGRSNVSFEHSVELDLHYIQNKSFWLNLRILLMTIPAVLTADGAY